MRRELRGLRGGYRSGVRNRAAFFEEGFRGRMRPRLHDQLRANLRRACKAIRTRPEASISQVEGSGTLEGVPPGLEPQGPGFFLPPLEDAAGFGLPFFSGAQTPSGNPGGENGMKFPPLKGL